MTDLDKKILESAHGEHRLNPDEQRKYFGTFAERLVLSILLADAENQAILANFDQVLQDLKTKYDSLSLKISPKLSLTNQMLYMKKTQEAGLIATIVAEDKSDSPFGLLVHTDKTENIDNPDIKALYPQLFTNGKETGQPHKKTFWQKWFQ
ncbi:hypothetical protein SMU26_07131 [Streptococcus mutans 3SN1]|uniref:YueI family protein n=1 Tax=Streptococcus mutans TaxID=1309 RepID=UPI0002B5D186|nr:YueI family protein [Streptococcus mutans]EMB65151.1 hypothetical protein SMU26_07131 [Streptococcus mutans 3SN1]